MQILVTGCAGFIGSHLCESLLSLGHNVIGLDNLNNFYDPKIKKNNLLAIEKLALQTNNPFHFIEADIRDNNKINEIFKQ